MATGQLWLFPPPRPLVERLGEDFFREVPARPGVYLMCGVEAGVLYVGRAKNLRRRLSSYRVANPERLPRRMIRLLHRVARIEFDVCVDEFSARQREESLICVLAPPFNRAGKVWPRSLKFPIAAGVRGFHPVKHE
ncbi:MAG: nucleotide excision repair endonuclease [Verrucomicrobiae bacterium]|nr:nucleotide excision repair endonuclease [Verrucomicrobiae bacterium]